MIPNWTCKKCGLTHIIPKDIIGFLKTTCNISISCYCGQKYIIYKNKIFIVYRDDKSVKRRYL